MLTLTKQFTNSSNFDQIITLKISSQFQRTHHVHQFHNGMFLNLRKIKSSFKHKKLYSDPQGPLPQFLTHHLLDDARVIKLFSHDPMAYIRIFFFQLLKYIFQSEDSDGSNKLQKLIDFVVKRLDIAEESQTIQKSQIDPQTWIKIIMEFFEYMGESRESVEKCLLQFGMIQKLLVEMLANFLEKQMSVCLKNNTAMLQVLSQFFEVDIVEYDDCIQFVDTQIYIYTVSISEVYLIYIDQEKTKKEKIRQEEQIQLIEDKQETENLYSTNEMISFDQPDVIFLDLNGSSFNGKNVLVEELTKESFGATITKENKTLDFKETVLKQTSRFSSKPVDQKSYGSRQLFDITNEFTNTLVLESVSEPYRNSIKSMKEKARAERKTRKMFLM